jgi:proteasome lid subunit RPN8/RPN11
MRNPDGVKDVRLADGVEEAMLAHARQTAPAECCGLLIGAPGEVVDVMPARNIAEDPSRRYLIDPRDHLSALRLARVRGLAVVGAYHSHPQSAAQPSPTDAAEAFGDFLFVIVGLGADPPQLTAWIWAGGNFAPVPLVRFRKGEG